MPVIDTLEKYKGNTFMVELSDGETIFLNIETVMKFNLRKGIDIPDEAVLEIKHTDQLRKARERALYLLDYRDYCFVELYKKLEANYDEEVCLEVLNWLCENGLVNDRRYATRLGEKLVVTKGFGYYRAKQEMLMKGLDRELVEEVLSEYEEDTLSRLEELVDKKYLHKITDEKSLNRVKNALVRQGYTYSDVNAVFSLYEFDFDE
ncbi:MAG: RecX family transcriptional regulator [Oscillospiraceae bacterium]|nr:RecX family transcriptional regulator [Oscillospiraceae bacterium]MBQ8883794.1 RecX family transcriptional regulator [Oscillospiraceae bacterium]